MRTIEELLKDADKVNEFKKASLYSGKNFWKHMQASSAQYDLQQQYKHMPNLISELSTKLKELSRINKLAQGRIHNLCEMHKDDKRILVLKKYNDEIRIYLQSKTDMAKPWGSRDFTYLALWDISHTSSVQFELDLFKMEDSYMINYLPFPPPLPKLDKENKDVN